MITLWGRNNSTNVKKVLWTLEELELPYDQILAGGKFGVNQDADYLAMNPNGLVPLLKDDETDLLLWESNAIVRYLAAQYGQNRLWVDNPAHRVILMGLVRTPPEKRDQAAIEAGIEKCDSLFALLDDALAHQPWFSGDNFGTGDIAIAPFVYNLLNVGLKWTPRPNLERWYQQLTERPAFRKVVMIPVT
ncbi:glutathione S-transferase family protein [Salmonella enterica]|nr:glutathione S-transferase family protein [Salmonella enterica]EJU4542681.1 glutathione S-transferase family protein [Salmonella enterica]EJV2953140.1 glutathione S-transferase family protein [Salmonella enterica]